jgi:NAD(P)H-hydrate epimerase
MERAAATCYQWIIQQYENANFSIFCAKGNNGGDGLAIARMLSTNHQVTVYILEFGYLGTEDFQTNLARLHETQAIIKFIPSEQTIPTFVPGDVIIDALFGSGLNRALEGLASRLVETINRSGNEIISIDIPSGLFVDKSSKGNMAVKAMHTISFECYKPAFLVPENEEFIGNLHVLNIGLHKDYLRTVLPSYYFIDELKVTSILKKRSSFAHKGTFGYAFLIAGSHGKMGAAVLAAKACLRAGVGLLTIHIPACGLQVLQTSVPEAMVDTDTNEKINTTVTTELNKYDGVGIGPGIGTEYDTATLLNKIVSSCRKPLVLDADALNIISAHSEWLKKIPAYSILTPHPKELERLFGKSDNDFERINLAKQHSKLHKIIIVLKGHYTFIATPDEKYFFNSTGNAGMATAGSGDVLTGIITSFLAQSYSPEEAAMLGVYLHGLSGDIAARELSQPSLIASDIIQYLGSAFKHLYSIA